MADQEPAPEPVVEEEKKEEEPAPEPEEKKEEEPAKAAPACSGECPCEVMKKAFDGEFFNEMKHIFMWEDLMPSLAVFCGVNIFFLILICYEFTVLGLFCWIAFFLTIAGLCVDIKRVIAYFKGEAEPDSFFKDKNFEVPAKYIDGFFDLVKSVIKGFINIAISAVLVRSVVFSLSMLGGFLFLIYLAGHLGMCGLLYGAILFCFIWFRLYHDKQEAIDNLWAKLKEFVQKQFEQLKEKLNKPKAQ